MKILEKRFFSSTVKLLDEFDSFDEHRKYIYDRLILIQSYTCYHHSCDLIIERLNDRDAVGDITMSKLLRGSRKESKDFREYAEQEAAKQQPEIFDTVIFSKPYLLRAQNSSNRMGYGNVYYQDVLMYEGTLYGETTDYCIVGIRLNI